MYTNEHIYKTETNSWTQRTDLWFPKGWGVGKGRNGNEISRGKLLYIEWINSKVLLDSTGNYTQYPMIDHHEKVYITESLCCTAEIFTTL